MPSGCRSRKQNDGRFADIDFALGGAFSDARQLRIACSVSGKVKLHQPAPIGSVAPRLLRRIRLHRHQRRPRDLSTRTACSTSVPQVEARGSRLFRRGGREQGPQASTVRILGKHGLRPG
jgi:hypothetical protein